MSNSSLNFTERDYTFKFEKYFDRGWEIFRKYAAGFIGFFIINLALSIGLSRLPENQQLIAAIISYIVSPILSAGYFIVAIKIAKNKSKNFADFFDGYKIFLPLFLVTYASAILIILGTLLLIIPGIYLSIGYSFAMLFVIEHRLGFWQALETSRKVISKKWFSFFGFFIVLGLINLAGLLALGIGILVTAPFTTCAVVAAFEDIVGWKTTDLQKEE